MFYCLHYFDTVNSTNTVAKEKTFPLPAVIFCEKQDNGHGRNGKKWVSKPGNLFMTICLENHFGTKATELSFVAGLAIYDAVASYSETKPVLKWPNDVLVHEKKISGILIENTGDKIFIGIGVNLFNHPENLDQDCCHLSEISDQSFGRDDILLKVIEKFEVYKSLWQKDGVSIIYNLWSERSFPRGKELTVYLEKHKEKGLYEGIDEEGCLLLKTDNKVIKITTADVRLQ